MPARATSYSAPALRRKSAQGGRSSPYSGRVKVSISRVVSARVSAMGALHRAKTHFCGSDRTTAGRDRLARGRRYRVRATRGKLARMKAEIADRTAASPTSRNRFKHPLPTPSACPRLYLIEAASTAWTSAYRRRSHQGTPLFHLPPRKWSEIGTPPHRILARGAPAARPQRPGSRGRAAPSSRLGKRSRWRGHRRRLFAEADRRPSRRPRASARTLSNARDPRRGE